MAAKFLLWFALTSSLALAFENIPLQDFCVADLSSQVFINGMPCKDPKSVQPEDFYLGGLHLSSNTSNPIGLGATPVTVAQIPGLNTLGISMVRLDFGPKGLNPPHVHPRASEILTVLEGNLSAGFVCSDPRNRLVSKVLQKGDVFVFPVGLVHFQQNVGSGNAVAIAALNSQNPGVITVANALFGSNPDIPSDLLGKALQVDNVSLISEIQRKF